LAILSSLASFSDGCGLFVTVVFVMGLVEQQFFPNSDRTELLIDVTLPQGSSIETTGACVKKFEDWLHKQPEAAIVTSTGGGAPRFFLAYNPEPPNPDFAKLVISTPNAQAQQRLLAKLRQSLAVGLVQEARVPTRELFECTRSCSARMYPFRHVSLGLTQQ
jgi:multidrug efflux pump subunit AcrB